MIARGCCRPGYFPAQSPDLPASSYWAKGLVASLLFFVSILLHELGHNLGLRHAHALACDPDCADVTYGDKYSFMGYTTPHDPPFVPGSLDSYQRQKLGVDEVSGTEHVKV